MSLDFGGGGGWGINWPCQGYNTWHSIIILLVVFNKIKIIDLHAWMNVALIKCWKI